MFFGPSGSVNPFSVRSTISSHLKPCLNWKRRSSLSRKKFVDSLLMEALASALTQCSIPQTRQVFYQARMRLPSRRASELRGLFADDPVDQLHQPVRRWLDELHAEAA